MPNAARTAAACRIARLDRQKFNDLMASGEYTCAPSTSPGVPRVFEMPDLIGLYLFTRLIERGRTVRQASDICCRIVSQVWMAVNNGKDIPDHVGIAYDLIGNSHCATGENVNPVANFAGPEIPVLWTEMWNVGTVRREVEKGLAQEARIVGVDD